MRRGLACSRRSDQPRVNTCRPIPGRSGTRGNRCPKGPPQLIDKSLIHNAVMHTAKMPLSRLVPLVRFVIRRSKPGTGHSDFPLPSPGQTGRPHAPDGVGCRGAEECHGRFLPVFSRSGSDRSPEGEKTRSRGSLEERLPGGRWLPPPLRNRWKPESCCPGVDPGASCGLPPPECWRLCQPEAGVPWPAGHPVKQRSALPLGFAQPCRCERPHREDWPAFPTSTTRVQRKNPGAEWPRGSRLI